MIEYQIIVKVFIPSNGGKELRHVVRSSDRESAVRKFKYLTDLLQAKNRFQENREWTRENLGFDGQLVNIEGLFGVSYVKILP